jgi:catecholate siderophore receptor
MAWGIEARGPKGKRHVLLAVGASLALAGAAHAEAVDGAEGTVDSDPLVVTGSRAEPLQQATGLATAPGSLQDLPQAVTVVSGEQLRTQNVTTLQQALRNVPGITVAIGEGGTLNGDQFKLRGQDASNDIYLDGLRDFGVYARDSFDFQEVQVLKGPSGALFGRGAVGGAINTVSKQPQLSDFGAVQVQGGNGEFGRATADLNKALGPNAAVRVNLMAQTADAVDRDVIHGKRWGAAVTGGIGLGTTTSLVASYMHQHDRHIPDYGITITQPPGQLIALPASEYDVGVGRSTYLGYDTDVDRTDADIFTVRFTHELAPDVTLTSDGRVGHYSRYFQYTTIDRCDATSATFFCTTNLFDGDPATVPNAFIGGSGPYHQDAWGAQNISTIRIRKPIGRFRNEFIGGFDISWQKNDKDFSVYALPPGVTARTLIPQNLLDPSHTPPAGYYAFRPNASNLICPATGACTTTTGGTTVFTNATATTVRESNGHSWDYGVFATDRFWLADDWSLIGSLRYDRYEADYRTATVRP